ncbi:hypothetical protein OH76DRAFT_650809 [Lentinus brumalis]|uniref:Secreted protein n=1 Tax=Lentinus brumalis TaxID=2498619 RepID=A0A371D848_9APHY|nr:hypothetical protein OH76DRAFT_650809 [Polyporus brumalis]
MVLRGRSGGFCPLGLVCFALGGTTDAVQVANRRLPVTIGFSLAAPMTIIPSHARRRGLARAAILCSLRALRLFSNGSPLYSNYGLKVPRYAEKRQSWTC